MSSLDRLGEIADRLDRIGAEQEDLYRERRRIWQAEIDDGTPPNLLASRSRVKPVTVRQLIARAAARQ